MTPSGASPPALDALERGVRAGDRATLARAVTLVESGLPRHQRAAQELLRRVAAACGGAHRVGITGVPGVGKSTFIDALGNMLVKRGSRVAVLAVDPSSARSGGSILGDKTRMPRLSKHENAFIRPSPSRGALGGVAIRTREAMHLVEAAGYDVVLVETVGVGQSETEVAQMVDCFVALMLPNAGDELQGIKRGLLELVDILVVHKADGELLGAAERARHQYHAALSMLRPRYPAWRPRTLLASSREARGIEAVWEEVEAHRAKLEGEGFLASLRADQAVRWMWKAVDVALHDHLHRRIELKKLALSLEAEVRRGTMPATTAAARIVDCFEHGLRTTR